MNRALALFFGFPGGCSGLNRSSKHIAPQMLTKETIFYRGFCLISKVSFCKCWQLCVGSVGGEQWRAGKEPAIFLSCKVAPRHFYFILELFPKIFFVYIWPTILNGNILRPSKLILFWCNEVKEIVVTQMVGGRWWTVGRWCWSGSCTWYVIMTSELCPHLLKAYLAFKSMSFHLTLDFTCYNCVFLLFIWRSCKVSCYFGCLY